MMDSVQTLTVIAPPLFLPVQVTLWVDLHNRVDPTHLAVDGEHDFFRLCGHRYR